MDKRCEVLCVEKYASVEVWLTQQFRRRAPSYRVNQSAAICALALTCPIRQSELNPLRNTSLFRAHRVASASQRLCRQTLCRTTVPPGFWSSKGRAMASSDLIVVGSYDFRLVALSILIALLASYAALELAGRVTLAHGAIRKLWLGCGATAMGIGIWSMHYVGMLAFRLPLPVQYDWPTVLVSLLAAIAASAIALFVVSRKSMGVFRAVIGSIFMGSAIAGMHYVGMDAMRLHATCHFSNAIVVASVVLAIVISFVALWLTFQ